MEGNNNVHLLSVSYYKIMKQEIQNNYKGFKFNTFVYFEMTIISIVTFLFLIYCEFFSVAMPHFGIESFHPRSQSHGRYSDNHYPSDPITHLKVGSE